MTAPGSARSALAYAITRSDLYRIYPDAPKLADYAGRPDGSLDDITSAAIPDQSRQALAGFLSWALGARPRHAPEALPVIRQGGRVMHLTPLELDKLPGSAGGDRRAGDAGLVRALVGEQRVVVDVALQAVGLSEQGDRGTQTVPGAGHLQPGPAATAFCGRCPRTEASRATEQLQAGHDRHAELAGPGDAGGWRAADAEPMTHARRQFADLLVPEDQWRSLAACLSADPDLFFPVSSSGHSMAQEAEAKAICTGCQVRRECLAFALRTHQAHGVWGGLSEQERYRARSAARRDQARPGRGGRHSSGPGSAR